MNRKKYHEIREKFRRNDVSDDAITDLIIYTEGLYLDYFLINLEFEMVSFVEGSFETKFIRQIKQDHMLEKAYQHFARLINSPLYLFELPNNYTILELLNGYRKEMEKRVRCLAAYSDFTKIFEYMIKRRETEFVGTRSEMDTDEAFCGEILGFLFREEDAVLINDKIKTVYSQLPIRMTSNRFFNYIDAALDMLKGVPCKDMDRYIESIMETFFPETTDGFGLYFKDIADGFKRLEKVTEISLSQEEYDQLNIELLAVNEKIEETIDFILDMVQIVNQLLGVASVINEQSIALNQDRIEHFLRVSKHLNHPELDAENASEVNKLLSELEGVIEDMADELGQSEVMVESILMCDLHHLEALKLQGRYEKVLSLSVLTSGSFFGDMSQKSMEEDEVVDLQYLARTKKQLSLFLEEKMSGEDKRKQRARMATTFSILNIVQKNPQEVYDFIFNSLKSCKNLGEKDSSKNLIRSIIKD